MFVHTMGLIIAFLMAILSLGLIIVVALQLVQNKNKCKNTNMLCICGQEPVGVFLLFLLSLTFSLMGALAGIIDNHTFVLYAFAISSVIFLLVGLFYAFSFFTSIYIHDKIEIKRIGKPTQIYDYEKLSIKVWVCNLQDHEKRLKRGLSPRREWVEIYCGEVFVGYFDEMYRGFETAKKKVLKITPKENLQYWRNDYTATKEYRAYRAEMNRRAKNRNLGLGTAMIWTNSISIFLRYLLLFFFKG